MTATFTVNMHVLSRLCIYVLNRNEVLALPISCVLNHFASLHRTAPHCTAPHRTAPHRTAPHRTAPHRTAPHRTAPHRTAPHRTALHCHLRCVHVSTCLFILLMRLSDASGARILGEETTRSRSTCHWIAKCQGNYNLSYVHTYFFCFVAKYFLLWFSSTWNKQRKFKFEATSSQL